MAADHKSFQLIRHIGMLSDSGSLPKMVSVVRWGDHDPSLDIRRWEGSEPKKGISLRGEEIRILCEILREAYPQYFEEDTYANL